MTIGNGPTSPGMDGASVLEETWLAARAGPHGYLDGKDAETIACDTLIVPVVTGSPDWTVIREWLTWSLTPTGSLPRTLANRGHQRQGVHPARQLPSRHLHPSQGLADRAPPDARAV